jgi:hypothetical protein
LQLIDAALNGLAFLALGIGLAIGWRRSPALRETLVELFLPSRSIGRQSRDANGAAPHRNVDRTEMTWKMIYAEPSHAVATVDADADDRKTLSHLRAIRA